MGDKTGIEWTDATWNPVVGCSIVSPGCTNCYAMRQAARIEAMGHCMYSGLTKPTKAGPVWTGITRVNRIALRKPVEWKRPRKIFVNSMSDLFAETISDDDILDIFTVMAIASHHEFQILTKRADRMQEFLEQEWLLDKIYANWSTFSGAPREVLSWPLHNVLIGVSVEDQRRADQRRSHLKTAADAGWRTFVSYEPALGPVDWAGWDFLSWLVSGGESGPAARPTHPDWHRAARDFCGRYNIPYFFKQWGEYVPALDRDCDDPDWRADYGHKFADGGKTRWLNIEGGCGFHGDRFHVMRRDGKRQAGRLLDGIAHNAMPAAASPYREKADD